MQCSGKLQNRRVVFVGGGGGGFFFFFFKVMASAVSGALLAKSLKVS